MNIEQVWPEWQVDRLIGKGSYGAVYRCFKAGATGKEYAAVKVISVPQDDYEAASIGSELPSGEQSREYYKDITDNFITEIKILEALKDEKHIVNIQDSKVVEKDDGIGWQIFIRMELLTDFNTWASDKTLSADDVKKLALDLCDALIVCGKKRIVHRDIKPENIFVDTEGNFKLGDFGVAKQLEKTYASMSTKGTYNYMAPEVVASKKYDSRADIYSLGLVMYKLLNNNRLPFLDPDKKLIRFQERQEAFERRIKGEKIPPLAGVDDDLNDIILKACEFRPEDRYRTVEEFRSALAKEKPSNRFVRLVKKHKVVSAIVFLLVVSIVSGSCGYGFAAMKERTRAYPEKHFALGENVVSLNGVGIVSDSNGLRSVDENTGKENVLSDQVVEDLAFNGKHICYTCVDDISQLNEMFFLDIATKEILFSFKSKFNLDPVFFDDSNMYFFKTTNDNGDHKKRVLCHYSYKEQAYKKINMTNYDSIDWWTIEQLEGHNIFVYGNSSEMDSTFFAVDIDTIKTNPEPTSFHGRYICSDNSFIYYSVNLENHISVLRCKYNSSKMEEVLQIKGEDYEYFENQIDLNNLSKTKDLIPISRKTMLDKKTVVYCNTYYDVYTQKKYQFLVDDDNIKIFSVGEGAFGYCTGQESGSSNLSNIEVGYIAPILNTANFFGTKYSKLYPALKSTNVESFFEVSNGIYYMLDQKTVHFKNTKE